MKRFSLSHLLKHLKRHGGVIYLNIAGLSLGLASVIFISLWITHETGYERFNKKADRIFRVESMLNFTGEPFVWTVVPGPAPEAMKEDFPEIEDYVIMKSGFQDAVEVNDEIFTCENLFYATPSYFNVFSPGMIYGDRESMLAEPESIVISERVSKKLFGDENPVDKIILFNNEDRLKVSGVIENPRSDTHLKVDYLLSFSLLERKGQFNQNWGNYNYLAYILLKPGTDGEELNNKLENYLESKRENSRGRFILNPLKRIYLYRDPGFKTINYPSKDRGPIASVILFAVIGIILLVIACINFINLSTAYATERAREIGVRKVNGAGRKDLVLQLFFESLAQTFIAMIFALVLVMLLLPVFDRISGLQSGFSDLFLPANIVIYVLLTVVTGLVAGFYPAIILSSFSPDKVIKPQPEDVLQGGGLRKILVVVQFVLAIGFIFCIMVMNSQLRYMQHAKMGFNPDNLMVIYPKRGITDVHALTEEIAGMPGVRSVAIGGNVPVNMGNWMTISRWEGREGDKKIKFHKLELDDNYFDLLGFELASGRELLPGPPRMEVIVNEAACRAMNMDQPLGKSIWLNENENTIVGVVKDFHFHKLKEEVLPVFMCKYDKTEKWVSEKIFVKLEPGDHSGVVDRIAGLISKNTPGYPARYIFLDDEIKRYYDEESRVNTLVNAATILSIFISCIGLFSLTAFTLRRKWKEIGIRKAHGASHSMILMMLQKEFSILILIASLIALPFGAYTMNRWLENYAYHINIAVSFFIVSFLLIVMVSAITILYHTMKASNINPAYTLRDE